MQSLVERGRCAERGEHTCPEHLPDHRGVLNQLLLGGRERVEPGGDHALHGLWQRKLAGVVQSPAATVSHKETAVLQHAHILLRIERIPFGKREHPHLELRRQQNLVEERPKELGGLFL